MSYLRFALFLGTSCVAACGGGPVAPLGASDADQAAAAAIDLVVPQPARDGAAARAPVERSSIPVGQFAVAFHESSHHGCSRSWASSSTSGKATLALSGGTLTLSIRANEVSSFGSRAMGSGPPDSRSRTVDTTLRGAIVETSPGKLRATLTRVACDGDCPDAAVEISCEVRGVAVEDRERPDADPALRGMARGVVCAGLGPAVGLSLPADELPFGSGAGFEISSDDFAFGRGEAHVFLARAQ